MRLIIGLFLISTSPLLAQRPFSRGVQEHSLNLAPFVPSPQPIVDRMLDLASVKQGETVYDLGCGDGRILITAAQRFKAKGIGIELSPYLVRTANESIKKLNLQEQVTIVHADLREANLQTADVVTIYLETNSNEMLRPNLEKWLRAGARVVSHDFPVRGWKPSKVDHIQFYNRDHTIYVYIMPPQKN
jgi:cyclopropane fatty-acyl-phospholipid synthase-like methyltransferase